MICPKCGKEMKHGYLSSGFITDAISHNPLYGVTRAYWGDEKKPAPSISDEVISKAEWLYGSFHIEGFRCEDCRTIMLKY